MTHQQQLTAAELQALHAKGIRYIVIAAYQIGQYQAGDIVSKHKSNYAAQKAAGASDWYAVKDIADEIAEANYRA